MDFDSYVRDSRTPLLRFAVVLTDDPHLAQDLVQDVLVKAQQQWSRIGSLDRTHAYVRRMLVNEAISWHRKWSRVRPGPVEDLDRAMADPTTEIDRRDALLRSLTRLTPNQRAAVVMRYFEDMPDSEIAAVLGCQESTVRVHIHRALSALRVEHDATSVVR